MLKRGEDARFMPGVWVFPGGVVDDADRETAAAPELEIDADEWAHRVCGARELGEEAAHRDRPRGAAAVVALDHAGRGPGPLRHPLLRRPRSRPQRARARPRRDRRGALVRRPRRRSSRRARRDRPLLPDRPPPRGAERFASADDVIAAAARARVEPILPRVVGSRDSFDVLLPDDPGYDD